MFIKNIKWYDWLIIAGITIIVLINPFIGQYVIQGIIWAYESLVVLSDMAISAGLTLILIGFIASKLDRKQRRTKHYSKLKDSKRESAGAYIATK